jgi:hypothetical protein
VKEQFKYDGRCGLKKIDSKSSWPLRLGVTKLKNG